MTSDACEQRYPSVSLSSLLISYLFFSPHPPARPTANPPVVPSRGRSCYPRASAPPPLPPHSPRALLLTGERHGNKSGEEGGREGGRKRYVGENYPRWLFTADGGGETKKKNNNERKALHLKPISLIFEQCFAWTNATLKSCFGSE